MFTGIVTAVGRIGEITRTEGGQQVRIDAGGLPLDDVSIGDSIAVSGVCLTVTALHDSAFDVDVSKETIECIAPFEAGAAVNLEKALRLSDRLGGHLVSGHIDGRGRVERCDAVGDNRLLEVSVPRELARYIARKGSIAIDGVSLTVAAIDGNVVEVSLIPETLERTTLGEVAEGRPVNVEIDLMARYAERLLQGFGPRDGS